MSSTERTGKIFGTDGIRGTPGEYPLTDGMIYKIGRSIAEVVLQERKSKNKKCKPQVIIGKDTRLSGSRIETILADAVNYYGLDVLLGGIITTPGLSYLVKHYESSMGIMISASHNKPSDNGIKFFNKDGFKLSEDEEEWMEDIIFSNFIHASNGKNGHVRGKIKTLKDAQSNYIKFLLSTIKGYSLKNMRIALDCAYGAGSPFAASLFRKLGAQVFPIHDKPSGEHINKGGALDLSYLREVVLEKKADIGVALDGDGDRGILVDEKGNVLDGDYILAVAAHGFMKQNRLAKNTVVGTLMSNYGLKVCIENAGGKLLCTNVGDKYVLETLRKFELNLGGEQSGHIIFCDYHTSPDGLLTALQILKVMKESYAPLSQLAACMSKMPQILVNVRVKEKRPFEKLMVVQKKLADYNARLKDEGRILLRYSGTENLARVMIEGKDHGMINDMAKDLAEHIEKEIGIN